MLLHSLPGFHLVGLLRECPPALSAPPACCLLPPRPSQCLRLLPTLGEGGRLAQALERARLPHGCCRQVALAGPGLHCCPGVWPCPATPGGPTPPPPEEEERLPRGTCQGLAPGPRHAGGHLQAPSPWPSGRTGLQHPYQAHGAHVSGPGEQPLTCALSLPHPCVLAYSSPGPMPLSPWLPCQRHARTAGLQLCGQKP